ncbi:hypothetical protein LDL08_25125 [Nonomuraea glycinis]|uniref:WD40 repeat domain-containing protein n=1 Tax=Nonomuraea glycinis TaxID=2047744 RepID=A0A918A731_9ACTN|nr:hypothetical protein [Nonomuraea glycinis]MCA2179474.1 hypothetical protein [Nonomuraea glycinis]GGP09662.1 hypothetical protein GCM10012278_45990 [Nonomuraea glycinis]
MTSWLEDQLRDALTADAEQVRPENLRPAEQAARTKTIVPRRRFALAVPLAAALVVVLIGTVAAMVAGTGGTTPTGPATQTLGGPRFLLIAGNDGVTVHDARTGKVASRLGLPPTPEGSFREPGGYLLAGAGDGATFYIAQSVMSRETQVSSTRFYRARVDEQGKPAELVRDVIPKVIGTTASSLALTSDGTRLAYSLDGKVCGQGKMLRFCPGAQLTVVDLPAGTRRTWTTDAAGQIRNLSWAADRRVLGFVVKSEARVLDAAAAGTTLAISRVVARGQEAKASAISPDGRSMLIGRTHLSDGRQPHRYTIDEYSVTDGRKIRTLLSVDRHGKTSAWWNLIRYDATGRHLLVVGNFYPLSRLDDGRVTPLLYQGPSDPQLSNSSPPAIEAAW